MTYYDPRQPVQPPAYPVDADGDRIYTEEDYALPADGDAFRPDEADGPEDFGGYGVSPFSYQGMYDTLLPEEEEEPTAPFEEELFDEEDFLTDEEREELRRSNWRLFAGLMDFGGIILGTAVILVLVALLVSLINWLVNDISQTFTLLQTHI